LQHLFVKYANEKDWLQFFLLPVNDIDWCRKWL